MLTINDGKDEEWEDGWKMNTTRFCSSQWKSWRSWTGDIQVRFFVLFSPTVTTTYRHALDSNYSALQQQMWGSDSLTVSSHLKGSTMAQLYSCSGICITSVPHRINTTLPLVRDVNCESQYFPIREGRSVLFIQLFLCTDISAEAIFKNRVTQAIAELQHSYHANYHSYQPIADCKSLLPPPKAWCFAN